MRIYTSSFRKSLKFFNATVAAVLEKGLRSGTSGHVSESETGVLGAMHTEARTSLYPGSVNINLCYIPVRHLGPEFLTLQVLVISECESFIYTTKTKIISIPNTCAGNKNKQQELGMHTL